MLDTLRADHLGFYGYGRDTSPNLDAFARENIAFKYAFTAVPWTPPSVATMFTGLYPASHGHVPPNSAPDARVNAKRLSPELVTLAEILSGHGYRTAAVSPNPWITPTFGFHQGFESFQYLDRRPAGEIVSAGIDLVERFTRRREPFFVYLHFLDPHTPYTPPNPYVEMFPGRPETEIPYRRGMHRLMRRYDAEIRYLDDELGRFFSFLKRKGLYDRALIVVIADHGEQFREHGGIQHGNSLFNEEVRVPFFIRDPRSRRRAEVVETVVSTVDLFPTILGQLDIAPPADQRDGISVFDAPALAKRTGVGAEIYRLTDQRAFISKDRRKGIFEVPFLPPDQEARRDAQWKKATLAGVYDFERDHFEQRPLGDEGQTARMRAEVEALFKHASARNRGAGAPATEMSDEVREQLKSLGYLK